MTDPHQRPEFVRELATDNAFGVVEKPLTLFERVWNQGYVRKAAILVVLAVIWEVYARWVNNELVFPTFLATVQLSGRASVPAAFSIVRRIRSVSCCRVTRSVCSSRRCSPASRSARGSARTCWKR